MKIFVARHTHEQNRQVVVEVCDHGPSLGKAEGR